MCVPLILLVAVSLVCMAIRRKRTLDSELNRLDQQMRGEKSDVDHGF